MSIAHSPGGDPPNNDAYITARADVCPHCAATDPFGGEFGRIGVGYSLEVACWSCHARFRLAIRWECLAGPRAQGGPGPAYETTEIESARLRAREFALCHGCMNTGTNRLGKRCSCLGETPETRTTQTRLDIDHCAEDQI